MTLAGIFATATVAAWVVVAASMIALSIRFSRTCRLAARALRHPALGAAQRIGHEARRVAAAGSSFGRASVRAREAASRLEEAGRAFGRLGAEIAIVASTTEQLLEATVPSMRGIASP